MCALHRNNGHVNNVSIQAYEVTGISACLPHRDHRNKKTCDLLKPNFLTLRPILVHSLTPSVTTDYPAGSMSIYRHRRHKPTDIHRIYTVTHYIRHALTNITFCNEVCPSSFHFRRHTFFPFTALKKLRVTETGTIQ